MFEYLRHVLVHCVIQIELRHTEHPVQFEPFNHRFRFEKAVSVGDTNSEFDGRGLTRGGRDSCEGGVVPALVDRDGNVRRRWEGEGQRAGISVLSEPSLTEVGGEFVLVHAGFIYNGLGYNWLSYGFVPEVTKCGHLGMIGGKDDDPDDREEASRWPIIEVRRIDVDIVAGMPVPLPV